MKILSGCYYYYYYYYSVILQERRQDGLQAAETVVAYAKWLEYERSCLAEVLTSASEVNASGANKNVLQMSSQKVQEITGIQRQQQAHGEQQQQIVQQPVEQQPLVQQPSMQPSVQPSAQQAEVGEPTVPQTIFVVPQSPHQFIYVNDDTRSYSSMRGKVLL